MMLNRGPQFVQLMNGYRKRRSLGSNSSRRHSVHVAMIGEHEGGGLLVRGAGADFEVLEASRIEPRAFAADHHGARRAVVVQATKKFIERRTIALRVDEHALAGVGNPACDAELSGEPVDEWPEADALHGAADDDARALEGAGRRDDSHGLSAHG